MKRPRSERPPAAALALDDAALRFLQTIWRLEHALERVSKRMEDAIGVSGPQRFALRLIGHFPGLGAAELASALHLHPSTITGMIQRLEARGLVEREPHATDRRRMHLRLTRAGTRLSRPATGTVEHAVRRTLAAADPRRRRAAAWLLDHFTNELMALE
jgi:DNA-binding MarR family transcriptional regulator